MKAKKRAKEKQEAIKAKQAEDLKKLRGMSPFSQNKLSGSPSSYTLQPSPSNQQIVSDSTSGLNAPQ